MKIELAKYDGVFDDDIKPLKLNKLKQTKPILATVKPGQKRVREKRILEGYTKEGYRVGFDGCSECHQHMVYCTCPGGILAPSIVTASPDTIVRVNNP
jgi:hypothetical protein